jgi:hypothetical protein
MYKPTQSVPHSGYNLQDLINELRARGYNLNFYLGQSGLMPILGTVTNTNTPNPTFYFDLNNIFAGTTSIQLDIAEDYEFETITYTGTPSIAFYGTSTGSYTLTEANLENGYYFWRIKVLNPSLYNLYSDVDAFEIETEEPEEPEITITPESGPVGTIITIEGQNFATETQITIDFGTHLAITTTQASENGTFSATFIVDAQPGGITLITLTAYSLQLTASFFIIESINPEASFSSGSPGDEVVMSGSGWPSNKEITISFGTHPTITTTFTGGSGTFSVTFIASTQPYGTTIITAEGCLATAVFFIKPKIYASPTSGPVGTTITAYGLGLTAYSLIQVDFGTHLAITTTQASENGTFSTIFIVDNQPEGTTPITITSSFLLLTSSFFITVSQNLPDLIITKTKVFPNRPIFEGEGINVIAWIENIGNAIAYDIETGFLDEEVKGTRTIKRLTPGQTEARRMTWRIYPAGTHTIQVIADPNNRITEIILKKHRFAKNFCQ